MRTTRKILFAEDSPEDVEMTLAALAAHNLTADVVVVPDGAEALDYLYRRGRFTGRTDADPLVILLDLKMPKVDGLEVLKAVKEDARLQVLPVVMLTSSQERSDLQASYQLGANGYVVKPVDYPGFVTAVQQLGSYWIVRNEPPPGSEPPAL